MCSVGGAPRTRAEKKRRSCANVFPKVTSINTDLSHASQRGEFRPFYWRFAIKLSLICFASLNGGYINAAESKENKST